jgi:hypothetical protein
MERKRIFRCKVINPLPDESLSIPDVCIEIRAVKACLSTPTLRGLYCDYSTVSPLTSTH